MNGISIPMVDLRKDTDGMDAYPYKRLKVYNVALFSRRGEFPRGGDAEEGRGVVGVQPADFQYVEAGC